MSTIDLPPRPPSPAVAPRRGPGLLAALARPVVALARACRLVTRGDRRPTPPGPGGDASFLQFADAMPQIVWAARPDGHLDYYNRRWYEFTGFSEGEGDGSWLPILHPDDAQLCLDTWYASVRTGRPYQIEYRFKDRQTGAYRWHLGRALPVRDADGRIVRWYGTCTDIDLQKRALLELDDARHQLEDRVAERTAELTAANQALRLEIAQRQQAEQRLQLQYATAQILAGASDLPEAVCEILKSLRETMGWEVVEYWQHDAEAGGLRCLDVSTGPTPALEEFARRSRLAVIDTDAGLPHQVWNTRKAAWLANLATGRNLHRAEEARKAGLASVLGFPVSSGNAVAGVLEFFRKQPAEPDADTLATLTGIAAQIGQFIDRKRAKEALVEATDRLQAVLDAATEMAIIATTPKGTIRVFNVGAERMLGYAAGELIGKRTPGVFHCPDEVGRYAAALSVEAGGPVEGFDALVFNARRGRPEQREWTFVRKDGTRLTASLVVTAQRNPAGEVIGFLGIAKDIGEHKRAEATLAGAKEAAEAANRAKGDFLATMSHEIRTPLNGILGMANLVLDTDLSPTQREYLGSLHLAAESLLALLNDILDFSKIEAGKLDLDPEPFDLRGGLADTLRPLSLEAHERGLEVAWRIAPAVPDALVGDFGRLRQILINLVGNAIKFTAKGEVVLDVRLEGSAGDEVVLRFAVRDTGIGIAKGKLGTIFEPFEQADGSTTRKYGGTGLGLTISARLARLLGGTIRVESEPGRGSTFSFTARMAVRPASVRSSGVHRVRGGRVLVIEDNATQRDILIDMLGEWGMTTVAVPGAEEGLEALREASPAFQAVLLDSTLPDGGASSFVRRMRQEPRWAGLPLIVMTAVGADRPSRWGELGLGVTLPKPIRQSQLRQAIREAAGTLGPAAPLRNPVVPVEPAGAGLRILLAEDNKINQVVMTHTLDKEGHRVVVAESGREVLEAVARETFDLILMDVAMPEMDGKEATRRLRAAERGTGRRLPVIALTANVLKGDREACLAAGMDAYVGKPFQIADLRAAIRGATAKPAPPASPPIDQGGLLARLEGNRSLLKTLTELFRVEGPRQLAAVRQALDAGDAVGVQHAAHTLKGAVALLSAPRAVEAAKHLEAMGKEQNLAGAEPAFTRLAEAIAELGGALDAMGGA